MTAGWRFAADVGGTFTDVVVVSPDGSVSTTKVLSTPSDFCRAVIDGVAELSEATSCSPADVSTIVHATTVATNAIIERKGRATGLLTTRGFRDVLELRRIRFPDTYNLRWEKPTPLVERRLRREVTERTGARGEIVVPLDLDEARAVLKALVEEDEIETLAVCLLNAYVNPAHEQAIGELASELYPELPVSLSSDVLPEIKEYERTSTTVLNAYLKPIVSGYLARLGDELSSSGYAGPLYLMQESGGVMTAKAAQAYPIHIIESGAAAGVVGGCELIRAHALDRAITFDMGGTTAKACLVEGGHPLRASEYEVGASISVGSRLLRGGGDLVRAPAVDVVEVGAGAGSIVHIDAAGALHVGPQSAGASPGPVCYRQGGHEPTVTDANVVLGYLPQDALLGGTFPIDAAAARAVIGEVARRIDLSPLEAAYGIHQIANAAMARAIRSVSTERGRDLRGCVLVVFGGSGPTHSVEMARTLGIPRVIVPRWPGVFSALGLLFAPIERRLIKTFARPLREVDTDELQAAFGDLERRAVGELAAEGYSPATMHVTRTADLHYRGQWYELEVTIAPGPLRRDSPAEIEEAFESAYEETYGYRQDRRPVDLVNIRVAVSIPPAAPRFEPVVSTNDAREETRVAFFGEGAIETPVVKGRERLVSKRLGPVIIDEFDSTIVVPPGASVEVDADSNVIVDIG